VSPLGWTPAAHTDPVRFVNAITAEELEEVTGEIHDAFFDIDDVVFDRDLAQVVIPFRRWSYDEARRVKQGRLGSTWEAPWYRWFLRVERVETFELKDEAQIGDADFGYLSYDEQTRALTIQCNTPVTISLQVAALAVTIEETGERLGLARYREVFGGESYSGEVFPLTPD
jgi:hypothetical protein